MTKFQQIVLSHLLHFDISTVLDQKLKFALLNFQHMNIVTLIFDYDDDNIADDDDDDDDVTCVRIPGHLPACQRHSLQNNK